MPRNTRQPDWWHLANRLRYVHGLTIRQIADELEVSKAAVEYATDPAFRERQKRRQARTYISDQLRRARREYNADQ